MAAPNPTTPTTVNPQKAEGVASYLCHFLMTYAAAIGLTPDALAKKAGVSPDTTRRLKHRRIRNYPQLLNFVKLLAAADLELQIVRVEHGMKPLPDDDPLPPTAYLTGTEGTIQWPVP